MQTAILDHYQETPTVTVFILKKPVGFSYIAGQFINVELDIENCDNRSNKRNFSLLSIPSDNYLMLATRNGISSFKKKFQTLTTDDVLKFTGPFGRFTLQNNSVTTVMLAGGMGITPLHAMIKQAAFEKLDKSITLIYSSSVSHDTPFKKDFDEYEKIDPQFKVCYTITDETDTNWSGKRGRINEEFIKELVPKIAETEFYVCGPGQMVLDSKQILKNMGIMPEKSHSEIFTGY